MHFIARALIISATFASSVAAQTPAAKPYDLDPYKPSDAALLRDHGDVLVAQTPLLELSTLDPYEPSQAALRRRIGAGLPLYVAWYPYQIAAPAMPVITSMWAQRPRVRAAMPAPLSPAEPQEPCACAPPPAAAPSSVATIRRPETNDGVWIEFQQRRWTSAGKTVPFVEADFARAGEYQGLPVYRRRGSGDDALIFVPTKDGALAPYRLKPNAP